MNFSYRCYILFYILSDLVPHTADELAEYLEVSKRTVNNDIKELKSIIEEFGAKIINRQNGYQAQIIDDERFIYVKNTITTTIMKNPIVAGKPESFGREFDICRIILSHDKKITNDDICDILFVSKETIKDDLKQVRTVLNSFGLRRDASKNPTNIIGKEFNIRIGFISLYYPLNTLYDNGLFRMPEYDVKFYRQFDFEKGSSDKLKDFILNEFERNKRMSRDNCERLWLYLKLIHNRCLNGHVATFTKNDLNFVYEFKEYGYALDILRRFELTSKENIEQEAVGLALFILMYQNYDKLIENHENYSKIYLSAAKLSDEVAMLIEREWNFPIAAIKDYYRTLTIELMPLTVQMRYGLMGTFRNYLKTNENEQICDPFSSALMLSVSDILNSWQEGMISRYNLSKLSQAFNTITSRIELKRLRKTIGVYSQFGEEQAKDLCNIIKNFIPEKYIQNIETVVPTMGENKPYDILVAQTQYWVGTTRNTIQVDFIPSFEQLTKIYNELLKPEKKADVSGLLFDDDVEIYCDCEYKEKYAFINDVAKKLENNKVDADKIAFLLSRYGRLSYNEGILVLPVGCEVTGKKKLLIYEMNKPMYWRKRPVDHVLIAGVDCEGKLENGLLYKEVLYNLSRNKESFKEIINGKDLKEIIAEMTIL